MKLVTFILVLFMSTFALSQTISIEAVHNSGTYSGTYSDGEVTPNLDWAVTLDIPMTQEVTLTPSLAYSRTNYLEYWSLWEGHETHLYVGLKFTYSISTKPLFE